MRFRRLTMILIARANAAKNAKEDPSTLFAKDFAARPLQQQIVAYGKASDAERQ